MDRYTRGKMKIGRNWEKKNRDGQNGHLAFGKEKTEKLKKDNGCQSVLRWWSEESYESSFRACLYVLKRSGVAWRLLLLLLFYHKQNVRRWNRSESVPIFFLGFIPIKNKRKTIKYTFSIAHPPISPSSSSSPLFSETFPSLLPPTEAWCLRLFPS